MSRYVVDASVGISGLYQKFTQMPRGSCLRKTTFLWFPTCSSLRLATFFGNEFDGVKTLQNPLGRH